MRELIDHSPLEDQHLEVIPERTLLAAILQRAVLDLEYGSYYCSVSAMDWFTVDRNLPGVISYVYVKEILNLSAFRIQYIDNAILKAVKRNLDMKHLSSSEKRSSGKYLEVDMGTRYRYRVNSKKF